MVVEMLQFVPFVKKVVIALMELKKNVQVTKPVWVLGGVLVNGALLVNIV